MEIKQILCDMLFYMAIYSFLGWVSEVTYHSVKNKKFINRGFLNLPFNISYGFVSAVLIVVLPTLYKNYILQYIVTVITLWIVRSFTELFINNIGKLEAYEYIDEDSLSNSIQKISIFILAAVCLVIYTIVHPILFSLNVLLSDIIVNIIAMVFGIAVIADFSCTVYAMRTGHGQNINSKNLTFTKKIAERIKNSIFARLNKAYPGIYSEKHSDKEYIFAKGISFDKLIWVFLISSILGALIEMVYCYALDGFWMNRSSLLYGPFSVVWGAGAVLLTVTLQKFAGNDRKVFLAGFVIGGVYEYSCSVLSELVFGTVFWDYSEMPLNIGGRTNVWYCIAWGILSVVWINIIYPKMSRLIEKLPALYGKIITWAIILIMFCNCMLTATAMVRYTERQTEPEQKNSIDRFIDWQYDDEYMEHRWPNMIITE